MSWSVDPNGTWVLTLRDRSGILHQFRPNAFGTYKIQGEYEIKHPLEVFCERPITLSGTILLRLEEPHIGKREQHAS